VPSRRKPKDREQSVAARKREVVQRESEHLAEQRALVGVHSETRISSYRGLLPPPDVLREFEALVPGAASRILQLGEDQARHRMDLERRTILADIVQSRWGLAAGTLITLVISGEGAFLIWSGSDVAGLTALVAPIITLAGVFVYGTNSRRREREGKAEDQKKLRR
jgi:uncharacterized membrane protein